MTLKDQIQIIKLKCGQVALGNGKCFICGCMTAKRGMTVHHRWYLKNNDVVYSDFPKNDSGNLEYYTKLYPKIVANPKRFMYLCNTDHQNLERFLRFGDKKFKQLCIARKMSQKNTWF